MMPRTVQLWLVACVVLGVFCSSLAAQDVSISLSRPIRPSRPYSAGTPRLQLQPASVGANLEVLAIGSVTSAPSSPLTITIASSDPTKLVLSPLSTDPSGTNAGVGSFTATLAAGKGVNGSGFPAFWLQSLASSGSATVTLSADGYIPANATISFTPAGFVIEGPNGAGANFTVQLGAADTNLTISAAQLNPDGSVLLLDQPLRGGLNVPVTLNDGTPATATVTGSPVSLQGGSSSNAAGTLKMHAVAAGTTVLSVVQPSGFTGPTTGGQLTATVNSPTLTLNPNVVGYNLQVLGTGGLTTAAPSGGLSVTITSSDPTKALLTTNATTVGSGSIVVTVPAGGTVLPPFYIQGLVSSGSVTLTASASGYVGANANVILTPSGFVINSPNNGGSFTTTTLASATALQLTVWQLNSSLAPVAQGQIMAGQSPSVGVVSGTTASGTIQGSPVTFQPNDSSDSGASFQPNSNCATPCTSVLSVTQPAGFSAPNPGAQITATVNQSAVTLRMTQAVIGNNLEVLASGALDVPAPSLAPGNGLQVTITSSDPSKIVLSSSATGAGTASIVVTIPAGSGVNSIGFPNYYVQSLSADSSVPVTLTVTPQAGSGFAGSNFNVTPAASGFVLIGPNGVGANFGTLKSNGNVNLTVQAAVLDGSGNPTQSYELVRGGFSASVTVSSDTPAVATIGGSPLSVTAGNSGGTITLQPQSAGTANISITPPAGYSKPATGDHLSVTIN